jgi:hypothetical protein
MRIFYLLFLLFSVYYLHAQQLQYNNDSSYIWGCGDVVLTAKLDTTTVLTISYRFNKLNLQPRLKISRVPRYYAEIERHSNCDFNIPYKCTDIEMRNNFDFVKYYYKRGLVQIRKIKIGGQYYYQVKLRQAVFLNDNAEKYIIKQYRNKINRVLVSKDKYGRF